MAYRFTDLIRRTFRSEVAHRHVTAISQFHRIQASPGYRAAAAYVAEQLAAAGLEVAVRRYPADGRSRFWTTPSFLEWTCDEATLHLLDEDGEQAERLCDFAAIPTSLIQRSIAVEGDFEVVALKGKSGTDPADYDGLDVSGKLVLSDKSVARVLELAVRQRGAAGILFDGMQAGGRTELDLPDGRQYTSFWWAGAAEPDGWGFVLSPRQGRALRSRLAEGKTVRVRAVIHSHFHVGSFEVVDARIPGADSAAEEVLLVSHLCHPQPGAHDNASGAAALIEAAATLSGLVAEGKLVQPQRGVRFLWPPEMTGTYAWLADHEADVRRGRWIAGLNLDMVGVDQCRAGSTWQLVSLPGAGSAFADHLLSWLREPFLDGQRHEETAFSAGSDHYILSDPTVGIPAPMLIQWPDRFYHTSADTPDKVSSESLGRSGALAAVYAYWLATAGLTEALWLGHWMVTRFAVQAGKDAAEAAEKLCASRDTTQRAGTWAEYRRRSAFHKGQMGAALGSLRRLDARVSDELSRLRARVAQVAADEDAWVQAYVDAEEQAEEPPSDVPWRHEAERLVPYRGSPGPIDVGMVLQAQAQDLLPAFWEMSESAGHAFHDLSALMQYWADGQRSIAEITDLVAVETGRSPADLPLRYFKLLAEAGVVEMRAQ